MNREMPGELQLSDLFFEILPLQQEGYCCSQIIVKLALRELGRENPELVRAMAGLCLGAGSSKGDCGILTGAASALSLSLGTAELPDPRLPALIGELSAWFNARAEGTYGGTNCVAILEARPKKRACVELLAATSEKLLALLASGAATNGDAHA